ncbi:MAG: FHA domain-containing protein [Actinomycetota bacterium]|nr:FHA domain-containing protein [Actinomycetota bacterium]
MPNLVLDLLKYVFLIVLYIFVMRAVRAVYMELKPASTRQPSARRTPAPASSRPPARKSKKMPTRAVVVEGNAHKGKGFTLGDELTVGRSDKCDLVLDDAYVSQMHARIFSRGESFVLEDMGSTNGTYLNQRRITSPVELQRGDRVKIGKTVLEMRK